MFSQKKETDKSQNILGQIKIKKFQHISWFKREEAASEKNITKCQRL